MTDETLGLLHQLSVNEVEPGVRYHCKKCRRDFPYIEGPMWWRCPTPDCVEWLKAQHARIFATLHRQLMSLRPRGIEPGLVPVQSPATGRNRGGRPRRPKVSPAHIAEVLEAMQRAEGRYPADKDLADELGLSVRSILNYRRRGLLPART